MTRPGLPGPHVVRVVRVGSVAGSRARLTSAERARHDALVDPRDRAAYVAAHVLARACVAALLGCTPDDVVLAQECPGCGRAGHGRPHVAGRPDVAVSLAHTRTWVAAAAARRGGGTTDLTIGVDVEDVRPVPQAAFSSRERTWLTMQHDPDGAATGLWVRKEALVKAGAGELAGVSALDVLDQAGRAHAREVRGCAVRTLPVPGGVAAAWAWGLRPPRPPARSWADGAASCPPTARPRGA